MEIDGKKLLSELDRRKAGKAAHPFREFFKLRGFSAALLAPVVKCSAGGLNNYLSGARVMPKCIEEKLEAIKAAVLDEEEAGKRARPEEEL